MNSRLLCWALVLSVFIGISYASNPSDQWEEDIEHTYLHFQDLNKNGIPNLKLYDNREFKGEPVYELNNTGFWFGKTQCDQWGWTKDRPPKKKEEFELCPIGICTNNEKEKLKFNPDCSAEESARFMLSSGSGKDDLWVRVSRKSNDNIVEVPFVAKTRPELRNAYLPTGDDGYKPWPKVIPDSDRRILYLNLKGLPPFTYHLSIIDKNGPERIKAFNDYRQRMHECFQKKDKACLKRGMVDMVGITQDLQKTKECKLLMSNFNAGSKNNQDAVVMCLFSDKKLLENVDGCFTSNNPKYPEIPHRSANGGPGYQQLHSTTADAECSLDADMKNDWKLSGVAKKEKEEQED